MGRCILLASIFTVGILNCFSQEIGIEELIEPLKWRNIGPANQGGRIVDVEALENDVRKVWLATGSGGVWYSENMGTTWSPIFDHYETASIGDIAVFQKDPSIIWVGTGEANNRNSLSWGNGVYKSTDGGQSFVNVGLKNTHHIARIILHPTNPNIAYVAALGHLWGTNAERGLYKTIDGGANWEILTNGIVQSNNEGCTDLVMHPTDPNILYSAFYSRLRKPYHFTSGSNTGGIYKSMDGGEHWRKLEDGLPKDSTGRIGLAISRSNPDIVMAIIEAKKTDTLAIAGSGIYRSEDGGEHWKYINTYNNRPFYYSQIRIHPNNPQKVYVLTTRFMVSEDGGHSFENGSEDEEIHGDFHAMWINPIDSNQYYIGADKGASITWDGGKKFRLMDNLPIAQYYRISYDMNSPYRVYGGLQDNGFYSTESFTRDARGILNDSNWKVHWGDGQYSVVNPHNINEVYTTAENGTINKLNPITHILENITPNIFNTKVDTTQIIKNSDQPFFRFNWSAPLIMSPHDNNSLYFGSQYVLKTIDKGKNWEIISPDLSSGDESKTKIGVSGGVTLDNTGAEYFGTLHSLSMSSFDKNILWAGTDEGRLYLSKNDGHSWDRLDGNFPQEIPRLWIDRIVASNHSKNRAYLTLDGHRSDVFHPYILLTEDMGKTWKSIENNISANEVIRSFVESEVNENLLFAGTETSVWFSINRGKTWNRLNKNLPTVSVQDLKIHPREKDLIAGTHGRSLWILDDIGYLEQFTLEIQNSDFHLFDHKAVVLWKNTSRGGQRGHFIFAGENPPGIENTSSIPRAATSQSTFITFYVNKASNTDISIQISDISGELNARVDTTVARGIHRIKWDMLFDAPKIEAEKIEKLRTQLLQVPGLKRSVKRALKKLSEATNAKEQRMQIEKIKKSLPGIPIPQEYLPIRATAKEYIINLTLGSKTQSKILKLKEDPLSLE